jgi:hypothetical protein
MTINNSTAAMVGEIAFADIFQSLCSGSQTAFNRLNARFAWRLFFSVGWKNSFLLFGVASG